MKQNFFIRFIFITCFSVLLMSHASATTYTLTAQTNGSGTVGLNPSGGAYPSGSVVTATATPSIGWYFVNWTGDASSSTNPLNVSITTNKVIIANFQLSPTYTLNTSVSGNGSVSLNPAGGTYVSNTIVTATALPATNWLFGYWTGDTNTTMNPLSIALD